MATTVYKPAGIPVFPPHADADGDCVLQRLLARGPNRSTMQWPTGFEGGIAHRLDTSTSGAIWVADDPVELLRMRTAFTEKRLVKRYRLLAAKSVAWRENAIQRRIGHDRRRKGRMVVERGASTPHRGRWYDARTEFVRLDGPLFQATMSSGVMHQIRVHAAFVGIPLLGDRRYGGGPTPQDGPEDVQFFLHHVGLVDADGWGTDPVETPIWARTSE